MPYRKAKSGSSSPCCFSVPRPYPEGNVWQYELKLDGFRAEGIKSGGQVCLRSRNNKDFNAKYPAIVQALVAMPDETVIDGEMVAVEESGSSFLQRSTELRRRRAVGRFFGS
jgi:bifunctional non-homologous end joining protein LigD